MRRPWWAMLVVLGAAAPALAQDATPGFRRVDVSVSGGWLANHRDVVAESYDEWNHRWVLGFDAGYYWTEHLKTELGVGVSGTGEQYVLVAVVPPVPPPTPYYYPFASENRRYRDVSVTIGQAWQFLQNQWLHPFVSAGAQLDWEEQSRERLPFYYRDSVLQLGRRLSPETHVRTSGFVAAGLKAYVSERAFVRTDFRVHAGGDGQRAYLRLGVGLDF